MTSTVINHPDHYVKGRKIQPIHVIEDWRLCHHLACVVKYVARCGRKENAHQDLLKAQWYLSREIGLLAVHSGGCLSNLIRENEISVSSIIHDWKLSPNLKVVLTYIQQVASQKSKLDNLNEALLYLQKEIQVYEGRGCL